MYYMMSFNPIDNLLMYWDEPTIAMDYAEHPLQYGGRDVEINLIPNVVLSSATLPHIDELKEVIANFMKSLKTQIQQYIIFKVMTLKKLFYY